jgi:hypothetical protein
MSKKSRIVSWDVGIKNLAYSVIEKDLLTKKVTIIDWDIVNIIDSDKLICCGTLKNDKLCGKKASLKYDDGVSLKYYCGSHKSQHNVLEDGWKEEYLKPLLVDAKCCYKLPKKDELCDKKSHFLNDNNPYCKTHSTILLNKKIKDSQLIKIKRKNATSTSPEELSKKMYIKLDKIKDLTNVDQVLIENQPSLKNPAMKTVSCFLFGYFAMKNLYLKNPYKINFVSPSNKLKINEEDVIKVLKSITSDARVYQIVEKLFKKYLGIDLKKSNSEELLNPYINKGVVRDESVNLVLTYLMNKKNTLTKIETHTIFTKINVSKGNFIDILKKIEKDNDNYEITKLLSIYYTVVLINSDWSKHLDTFKKKDDLCDAYLQGINFLLS